MYSLYKILYFNCNIFYICIANSYVFSTRYDASTKRSRLLNKDIENSEKNSTS